MALSATLEISGIASIHNFGRMLRTPANHWNNAAEKIWREYPVLDFGKTWDFD
jgi:hypothetical protein